MEIDKLLADEPEEKLTAACPISVWADMYIDELRETKGKGTYTISTKELYENYKRWIKDTEELQVNIQSFGVRLSNLKLPCVSTKLTKHCSMRVFKL
jgi:hypothetical protein